MRFHELPTQLLPLFKRRLVATRRARRSMARDQIGQLSLDARLYLARRTAVHDALHFSLDRGQEGVIRGGGIGRSERFALLHPKQRQALCAARASEKRCKLGFGVAAARDVAGAQILELGRRRGQELLSQAPRLAVDVEIQLHEWCAAGIRTEYLELPGLGLVLLEQRQLHRSEDRRLAELVGPGQHVEAAAQAFERDRFAETADLLQTDRLELHEAPPASTRRASAKSLRSARSATWASSVPPSAASLRRCATVPSTPDPSASRSEAAASVLRPARSV